jgi:hypothetical protein
MEIVNIFVPTCDCKYTYKEIDEKPVSRALLSIIEEENCADLSK